MKIPPKRKVKSRRKPEFPKPAYERVLDPSKASIHPDGVNALARLAESLRMSAQDPSLAEQKTAREDFPSFVSYMKSLELPFASHQKEWADAVVSVTPGGRVIILSPRGHGKSSILLEEFPSWLIGNDPNIRILLCSGTYNVAKRGSMRVRNRIESNARYKSLFGKLKPVRPTMWTQTQFIVKRSKWNDMTDEEAYPTLAAIAVGSTIPGFRADVIILDDAVNNENVSTQQQRDNLAEWYKQTLIPILEPHGKLIVIGTRWHFDDLYNEMLQDEKMGRVVQEALLPDPKDDTKYVPLWPEKFTLDFLEDRRSLMGSIYFLCQYMNNPEALRGNTLHLDWLHFYSQEDMPPLDEMRIYLGVDLAISEGGSGDFFVIATVGLDRKGQLWLMDLYRNRLDFPAQVATLLEWNEIWHPHKIAIESNAYQLALFQTLLRGSHLPVVKVPQHKAKKDRIMSMAPHFEAQRIKLRPHMGQVPFVAKTKDFEQEWVEFPRSAHDDLLDATEMAMSLALATRKIGFMVTSTTMKNNQTLRERVRALTTRQETQ